MFPETSHLSRSSSEYSIPATKVQQRDDEDGAIVVKPHSGRVLMRHWIHIAAVMTTATLATINIRNIYLMDGDNPNAIAILNAFQFAAKVHEVLIVGSLMLIMMDTVRSKLITPMGVPFGQILAPILFNDLDWLISHHFWSSIRPTRDSFGLSALVLIAIPFANVAGPLSAIAVIPRPGWSLSRPAAVFPSFWNSSASTIWPTVFAAEDLPALCSTGAGANSGCPGSAMKGIFVTFDPGFGGPIPCITTGASVSCNDSIGESGPRDLAVEFDINSLTTFASTPPAVIYQLLATRFISGVAVNLDIPGTDIVDAQKTQLIEASFKGGPHMLKPATKVTCEDLSYSEIYTTFQDSGVATNWTTPLVSWLKDIDETSTPSFLFTYLKNDTLLDDARDCTEQSCYSAIRCTINAYWVPINIWHNTAQASLVFYSDPQPARLFASEKMSSAQPVVIQRDWLARYVLPLGAVNISQDLTGLLNHYKTPMIAEPSPGFSKTSQQGSLSPTNYTQAISVFMAALITESLSRSSLAVGESVYTGDCNDTKPGFTFDPQICAQPPSDWIHGTSLGDIASTNVMVSFGVQRNGFGWFIDNLTVKIALSILLFHGFLILIYIIASLTFKRTITTCWSSAPEMLMLAVDSIRAPTFMGSSAKASHGDLWKEPVSVMEVDGGERVSLIVGDPLSYPDRLGGPPILGKKYN